MITIYLKDVPDEVKYWSLYGYTSEGKFFKQEGAGLYGGDSFNSIEPIEIPSSIAGQVLWSTIFTLKDSGFTTLATGKIRDIIYKDNTAYLLSYINGIFILDEEVVILDKHAEFPVIPVVIASGIALFSILAYNNKRRVR